MEDRLKYVIAGMIAKMVQGVLKVVDYLLDWNFGFCIHGNPESKDIEQYFDKNVPQEYLDIANILLLAIWDTPKSGGIFAYRGGAVFFVKRLFRSGFIRGWLGSVLQE